MYCAKVDFFYLGSHYSYDYQSSVSLLGDDARGAHDLVLHLDARLTVDTVWLKDSTHTEKILRFQVTFT